jgi:LPPG:FO 2-phospho-L-lactate transferase
VVPVTDDLLRTLVDTDEGILPFQHYFVRRRCEPTLRGLQFAGADQATLSPAVRTALTSDQLAGVILCPSNPYLSIAPLLAVAELRERLRALPAPVVAVSPIVGGNAIKGPTAKIMRELGVRPDARVVAELYGDFVDSVVVDEADAALVAGDARFAVRPTVMTTAAEKAALARDCIELIHSMR